MDGPSITSLTVDAEEPEPPESITLAHGTTRLSRGALGDPVTIRLSLIASHRCNLVVQLDVLASELSKHFSVRINVASPPLELISRIQRHKIISSSPPITATAVPIAEAYGGSQVPTIVVTPPAETGARDQNSLPEPQNNNFGWRLTVPDPEIRVINPFMPRSAHSHAVAEEQACGVGGVGDDSMRGEEDDLLDLGYTWSG